MSNLVDKILKISRKTAFDFRKYAYPEDELSYLFSQWVDYYKMKFAICNLIKPKNILEIGVRYGYSAVTFLKAAPHASYIGIDNDSATFGGSTGAFHWAKKITEGHKADFLLSDTQKMKSLPGTFYDLIHIDGQQDGDGTFHDLEMALEKGRYILVDGFFWSTENMLSSTFFMKKYSRFFEYSVIIPGYAGDLLIKTKDNAKNMFSGQSKQYSLLRDYYDRSYYLSDCGGYEAFSETNGTELDERLRAVYALVNPRKDKRILDIGCGRGELAYAISQSGALVVGLDYSKDAIEIAKKTFRQYPDGHLEFLTSEVLDYKTDEKFDIIIASDIIEHIEQEILIKVLKKVSALLKEDGRFIIHTAPNLLNYQYGYSKRRKLIKQAGSYIPANPRSFYEDLMHINEFTPGRLNRVLKSIFTDTLTWVNHFPDLAGSLERRFHKNDFAYADSVFAIASNGNIDKQDVLASISQYELDRENIFIEIGIKEAVSVMASSKLVKLPLTIYNKCESKIASFHPNPVYLSYHWTTETGGLIIHDGIRTPLNSPILPGEFLETFINVVTPGKPGNYVLQITLVQEGCFWFEDVVDNLPLKLDIHVNEPYV